MVEGYRRVERKSYRNAGKGVVRGDPSDPKASFAPNARRSVREINPRVSDRSLDSSLDTPDSSARPTDRPLFPSAFAPADPRIPADFDDRFARYQRAIAAQRTAEIRSMLLGPIDCRESYRSVRIS